MLLKASAKILCLLLVCCMCFIASPAGIGNVAAATTIEPRYTNISSIATAISFTGTTANCDTTIVGNPTTSSIKATMTLSRKNADGTYTALTSWSPSASNNILAYTGTYNVMRGYTYRIDVTAVVTRDGTSETVTIWAEKALA